MPSSPPTSPSNPTSPTAVSPVTSPQPQPPTSTPHANPKVAELQLMFPTVEPDVIEVILESCGGSTDRAIETLLQMTDPEFKPELAAVRSEEESQLDLDAQFARSLQMQEQNAYRQQRSAPPPPADALGSGQLPYQPRVRRNQPNPQALAQAQAQSRQRSDPYGYQSHQGEEGANPPGMLAVEEKLERFAEAGKQTFNSLLSKAKAKYTEYQTQQAQGEGAKANSSNWARDGVRSNRDGERPIYSQGGGRGGEQNRSGTGGLWGEPRLSNTPSMRSESFSSSSTLDPPLRTSSNVWKPSDAYDDPSPPARSLSSTSPPPAGRRSPGTLGVGSPEKGAGKIDLAKLGILPKKRVDLLSTSPQAHQPLSTTSLNGTAPNAPGGNSYNEENDPNPGLPSVAPPKSLVSQIPKTPPHSAGVHTLGDSDDDELEYTRNPFDE